MCLWPASCCPSPNHTNGMKWARVCVRVDPGLVMGRRWRRRYCFGNVLLGLVLAAACRIDAPHRYRSARDLSQNRFGGVGLLFRNSLSCLGFGGGFNRDRR
jgi:hypothetical protein